MRSTNNNKEKEVISLRMWSLEQKKKKGFAVVGLSCPQWQREEVERVARKGGFAVSGAEDRREARTYSDYSEWFWPFRFAMVPVVWVRSSSLSVPTSSICDRCFHGKSTHQYPDIRYLLGTTKKLYEAVGYRAAVRDRPVDYYGCKRKKIRRKKKRGALFWFRGLLWAK